MSAPLIAHVSHWAMWVFYMVPVVIVLIASARSFLEQRREGGEAQ